MKDKLPFGLIKSDLNYPKDWKDEGNRIEHTINIYNVRGIGWVVATLHISNGGRSSGNSTARTYAVDANGKVWRVGKGPHVLETLTAYVTKKRIKDLAQLIELYTKGAADANVIRDRISSRRAQGALHRAAGHTYWKW